MPMVLNLVFIFLFSFSLEAACRFKAHGKKIVSLSGPMTVALSHMGLLQLPEVIGISVFNPISKSDFKRQRYPGGVFISHNVFSELSGSVIFYDESRELTRILDPMSSIQGRQIKTRNLSPGEVTKVVIKELEYFVDGCEKELTAFSQKTLLLEEKILAMISKPISVLYFLGTYRMGKAPEILMVNDGIVKWLREKHKIVTYPSTLAYVNWSAKILSAFPRGTLKIAVSDSAAEMTKKITKVDDFINFEYPGALVPGISQLEAWNYLLERP